MKFSNHVCVSFLNTIALSVFLNADILPESAVQRNDISSQYVVLAPRTVRPDTLYGVTVTLLSDQLPSMWVRAEISRDEAEVAKGSKQITPFFTDTIFLEIPQSSVSGSYRLKIEGSRDSPTGGTIFSNETELVFSTRFLSIVVQTSKPIYNSGQHVYFRVILLTTELTPFEDAVDVYVIDPDGLVMRRWVSMQLNSGVVSHKFVLPQLAKAGFWKIRVQAGEQIEEQPIKVEAYFTPQFEVHVLLPPYVHDTDEAVTATIASHSELQRIVRGNATLTLRGRRLRENGTMTLIYEERVSLRNGSHELVVPMETIRATMENLNGIELRLEASVSDYHYGETSTGFSHTRIITSSVKLRFLGPRPQFFKPGTPLEGYVYVSYDDDESLSEEKIASSNLTVHTVALLEGGGSRELPTIHATLQNAELPEMTMVDNPAVQRYLQEGVLYYRIDVPTDTSKLLLTAYYQDTEGTSSTARLAVIKHFTPRKKYLSVRTSTPHPQLQEFAVFHVKANFHLSAFHYVVLSKGLILYAGQQSVQDTVGTTTTFVVPVAMRMAPGFTLLVYHVTAHGDLLSDKVFLPAEGFKGYECYVEVNQGKDRTKKTAQAIMPADAGAFMGINSQRAATYFMQAGNEISKSRIIESFFKFENFSRPVAKVTRKSRQGLLPDESTYLVTMNDALDTHQVFTLANVLVFTDAHLPVSETDRKCDQGEGFMKCFTEGCVSADKKCDGREDCSDLSDETECEEDEDRYHYKISRRSISSDLYDAVGNNWGWQEMNGEYGGDEFLTMSIPPAGDDYYFSAFSVSKTLGFTTIEEPVQFSTTRPFMMHLEGPSFCHRGEQVGLRVLLLNNEPQEAFVFLRLHGSPDYKFVHVEKDGIVTSYGARLETGEHQHIVYLPPGKQQQVDIPIAPTIEQGEIEITVSASTQVGHQEEVHKLTVLPEGGHINKHTSVFLDLKNRALVLRYLDIFVEESPIVPYQDWRRYVFGSPKGTVTLSGDVIGPIFPTIPLTTATVLRREMKGTVAHTVELAANIWTLHYLRLTNRLQRGHLKQVLAESVTIFNQVMRRYDKQGHFRNWDASQPSVWLTSWALRIFKHASFQDWENHLYIEPQIFTQSTQWILTYQMEDGSFVETTAYKYPLDFKMYAKSAEMENGTLIHANVPLTAHVLITLNEVMNVIQGSLRTTAATAALKATRFLEHYFTSLSDPYEVAISAYALTMTESSEKEYAFWHLHKVSREGSDGQLYWSRYPIQENQIKRENQKPFLRPREYQEGDSLAVEATAYALLVYLIRDGVTVITEKIVDWLTSVRMTNNGFISTIDTVVALQALTEYGARARIMDITNMDVSIEFPSSGSRETIHIGNESLFQLHSLQIPKVWSHVNIVARGSGQAMVQMDVSYGVDYQHLVERPMKDSFKLAISEFYNTFRNKSSITIESCFRWVRSHPPVSAATILEIQLPTGYGLLESEAVSLVESKVHPTLRDARSIPGKTIWFFDHVLPDWTCFNHTVRRWFPVANMTLHRQAFLYEAHAREHFEQVLVNSTPLYILSICEVCGSYQCPYCPHYSAANQPMPTLLSTISRCILGMVVMSILAST